VHRRIATGAFPSTIGRTDARAAGAEIVGRVPPASPDPDDLCEKSGSANGTESMTGQTEFLAKRSGFFLAASGAVVVILIGIADQFSGTEISFSIFYLLPVMLVTWYAGRTTGILIAVFGAVTWLVADLAAGHRYSHPAIPYWNMTVRLGFFLIVLFTLSRLKAAFKREKALSSVDSLTGAANSRVFRELSASEIDRSRRYGRPFTAAYIDLDDFKEVNDRFGHSAGDDLLRSVTEILRTNMRSTDIVARLGGDEFAVLFPETGAESAGTALEKIRILVSDSLREKGWPVTLSIGAVTFLSPPVSVDSMIRQVDELMYSAKHAGKNRIRHEVHRA
jgi:diguanylate cyclase (GGDEF)-like protein